MDAPVNVAIEEWNITSSDHLSLIIKLSTKATLRNMERRKKNTWKKYKNKVEGETNKETEQKSQRKQKKTRKL